MWLTSSAPARAGAEPETMAPRASNPVGKRINASAERERRRGTKPHDWMNDNKCRIIIANAYFLLTQVWINFCHQIWRSLHHHQRSSWGGLLRIGQNMLQQHYRRGMISLKYFAPCRLCSVHLAGLKYFLFLTIFQEFAVKIIEKCIGHSRGRVFNEIEMYHISQGQPNILQVILRAGWGYLHVRFCFIPNKLK